MKRDPVTAEHEAAHVAVGLALGLKLRHAEIRPDGSGGVVFWGRANGRRRLAYGLMYAAGPAITRLRNRPEWHGRIDRRRLRELGFSADDRRLLVGQAQTFLAGDGAALLGVLTLALAERDLTGADVSAILSGDE